MDMSDIVALIDVREITRRKDIERGITRGAFKLRYYLTLSRTIFLSVRNRVSHAGTFATATAFPDHSR
jgi:hypothetical protein